MPPSPRQQRCVRHEDETPAVFAALQFVWRQPAYHVCCQPRLPVQHVQPSHCSSLLHLLPLPHQSMFCHRYPQTTLLQSR